MVYQTLVYKERKFDEKLGKESGNILLFQSALHTDPANAIDEFHNFQLPEGPWFAYLREGENVDTIIEEELFDWYWIEGLS